MPTDPHVLGQRIAGLRRGQGWSQRRLAAAAGVSHGYVALLELGRLPSPGKFRLDAIARALNLRTADALLGPLPGAEVDVEPEAARQRDQPRDGSAAQAAAVGRRPLPLPARLPTDAGPQPPPRRSEPPVRVGPPARVEPPRRA